MNYHVAINPGDGESVTVDIVTLIGRPKNRFKGFMRYLSVRLGTHDYHTRLNVIRALGFDDLVKAARRARRS